MVSEGVFAKLTIIDPDVAVRIDGIDVKKVRCSDNKIVKPWRLENYQSTEEVDLEDGDYYLSVIPYWRQIDPLPVWYSVKNTGTVKLLIKCILSKGGKAFKNVTTLKSGSEMNIAGCYDLEYKIGDYSLRNLSVLYINGLGRQNMLKLVKAGIMEINDLAGKEAYQLSEKTGIRITKLAEYIRKAEIACSIAVSGEFGIIGDGRVDHIIATKVSDILRKTGKSREEVEEMMDDLGNLAVAIDGNYLRKLQLEDLFE
ncbi:MAG: hypothetical protein KKD69_05825 [Euryarchaeota archaeon]|nr:hypothetical protein [Euryarchaeota archaeon]MBU4491964.1 hypothetical protein [Euryarchaeota archaeon]MCG2728568.1 hypothetical protein [Candidatus Methanoperedenaceae archaeon]